MAEWFEDFFGPLYGRVLGNQFDEARSNDEAQTVKRLLRLRKGAKVLDLPCGLGRLTVPLARMGLVMTGVDLTASYIHRARRRAQRDRLDISFQQGDMRRLDVDGAFDGIFNWFSSFGYFSDAVNLDVCRRMHRALKPGGRLLIESINRSWLLAHYQPHVEQLIGGVRVHMRNRFDTRTQRARSTWTFSRGATTESHSMSMRLYNGTEIRALLNRAGFRDIELFGHPPVGRFTRHARRFMAVGRRPSPRS